MGRLWTKNLKDLLEVAGSLLAIAFLLGLCLQVKILKINQKTLTLGVQSQGKKIHDFNIEHILFRNNEQVLKDNQIALLEVYELLNIKVNATAQVLNLLVSPYEKEEADIFENVEFNLWKMEKLHGR